MRADQAHRQVLSVGGAITFMPILQKRTLRHREAKQLAQGHTATYWQSWDWNPDCLQGFTLNLLLLPMDGSSHPRVKAQSVAGGILWELHLQRMFLPRRMPPSHRTCPCEGPKTLPTGMPRTCVSWLEVCLRIVIVPGGASTMSTPLWEGR